MSVKYSSHARERLQEIQDKANLSELPDWIAELIVCQGRDVVDGHHKCESIGMTTEMSNDLLKILKKTRVIYDPNTDAVVTVDYPIGLPDWIADMIVDYGRDIVDVPHKRESIGMTTEMIKDLSKILKRTRVIFDPDTETVITVIYPYRPRKKSE